MVSVIPRPTVTPEPFAQPGPPARRDGVGVARQRANSPESDGEPLDSAAGLHQAERVLRDQCPALACQ